MTLTIRHKGTMVAKLIGFAVNKVLAELKPELEQIVKEGCVSAFKLKTDMSLDLGDGVNKHITYLWKGETTLFLQI